MHLPTTNDISQSSRSFDEIKTLDMVRQKTRWLLIRINYERINERDGVSNFVFLRKELSRAIHDSVIRCFGIAMSGAVLDTQGKPG